MLCSVEELFLDIFVICKADIVDIAEVRLDKDKETQIKL